MTEFTRMMEMDYSWAGQVDIFTMFTFFLNFYNFSRFFFKIFKDDGDGSIILGEVDMPSVDAVKNNEDLKKWEDGIGF